VRSYHDVQHRKMLDGTCKMVASNAAEPRGPCFPSSALAVCVTEAMRARDIHAPPTHYCSRTSSTHASPTKNLVHTLPVHLRG